MFFQRKFVPGLAIYSYLIGDLESMKMCVVDPTRDVEDYLFVASEKGFEITDIVETHVHADFISGSKELKARLGGKPTIHCSSLGGKEWIPRYADRKVLDGDTVVLGSAVLKALHTPGHTSEHLCWQLFDAELSTVIPILILTGDFLFIGSVGRPDLLGEKESVSLSSRLYNSIFKVLPTIADNCEVYPAHGAGSLCGKSIGSRTSSTVGYEFRSNPYLQPMDEAQWTEMLMDEMPMAPAYFQGMKKINIDGPQVIGSSLPGNSELKEIPKDAALLDVRSFEDFASGHLQGSINIPFGVYISSLAALMLSPKKTIVLILERADQFKEVVTQLLRVGFDEIAGYKLAKNLNSEGLGSYKIMDPMTLASIMRREKPYLLDVRSKSEFEEGHIEGSVRIELGELESSLEMIPKDKKVVTVCAVGVRSALAAGFLKSLGYKDVANLSGGYQDWKRFIPLSHRQA